MRNLLIVLLVSSLSAQTIQGPVSIQGPVKFSPQLPPPVFFQARTDNCVKHTITPPVGANSCNNGPQGKNGSDLTFLMRDTDTLPFASLAPANTSYVDPDFGTYSVLATDNTVNPSSTTNHFNLGSDGNYDAFSSDDGMLLVGTSGGSTYLMLINKTALFAHTCAPGNPCIIWTGVKTGTTGGCTSNCSILAAGGSFAWSGKASEPNVLYELDTTGIQVNKLTITASFSPPCSVATPCAHFTRTAYVNFGSNSPVNCAVVPSNYSSNWVGTFGLGEDGTVSFPSGGAGDWLPNHAYTAPDDWVYPLTGNAKHFGFEATGSGTSGGSAPAWPQFNNWVKNTVYNLNDEIVPTAGNFGYYTFQAQNGGTSGSGSHPTWCQSLNCTVNDNGITWKNVGNTVTDNGVTWTNTGRLNGQDFGFDVLSYTPGIGCSHLNTKIGKIYRGTGNSDPAGTWQTDQQSICTTFGLGAAPCTLPDVDLIHDGSQAQNGSFFQYGGSLNCGDITANCSFPWSVGGSYANTYYWQLRTRFVRPALDNLSSGHAAKCYKNDYRGSFYTAHAFGNPTNDATGVANPGQNALAFNPPTGQHGTCRDSDPNDAMPAFLQPQDAPSVGRNGANSPYQFYTQSTYDEITGVKTDGSQICVSGLDCPYRFGHNWNTGNSFNFSIQYGIGVVSQTGKLFAMGSDAMNTRGSTSASTWTLNHAYSVGDTINPNDSKNTLHFTYLATAVSGNSGGTEPTWDTGCTTTCTDGGVTWTRTNTPCNRLRADFWQWTNSLSITAGDRIYPASGNAGGFIYQADRTHATSGSVPSWCQNYGCTTTNGSDTIVWTNIGVNDCRGDVIVFDLTSAKH